MVPLFYVDDCLMFSPSKDKIEEVYASIQVYFNIEDDGELNKYIGIDLDRCLRLIEPSGRRFRSIPR